MFVTERNRSKHHVYFETLSGRAELDRKESADLRRHRSGYSGECEYDAVLDAVGHDNLFVFRDIWLRIGGGEVQFDALIVADNVLAVNEIKNYSGNYSYENGVWRVRGQQISEDPVSQLSRAAGKLVKLRNESGFPFDIEKEIVFINPYFIFGGGEGGDSDGAGGSRHFIMRNRLKQYFRSLGNHTSGRSAKVLSEEIAGRIIADPYPVPETDYGRLRLGVNCFRCGSFDVEMKRFVSICRGCGYAETVERLVVRTVVDFAVLFPGEEVTKKKISDFLDGSVDLQRVQRLMKKYFPIVPNSSRTHYRIADNNPVKTLKAGGYSSHYEHDPEFMFETHPRRHKLQANYL
ncbi:nuclease-related domain-containing protein [Salinicoccus carnicancri]|uniref:nuclease-related domain-containing protein n=1 Tax=Salinicoccus carnicancri TaxID=558170 RepID=UPI0002E1AF4C|nr:nuclease-related domain-containing protein [Salinicoccus carnicancri]